MAADRTSLALALDSTLSQLPEGASYTSRSGRASVKASVKRGPEGQPATLIIESSCDSLERLCVAYETANERLSAVNASLQQRVEAQGTTQLKSVRTVFDWWSFAAGVVAGAVVMTILLTKKKV